MPRRKSGSDKGNRHGSAVGRAFRFLIWKPVRIFILICVFVGLLFWQQETIFDTGTRIVIRFGWGLVLIESALAVVAIWIALRRARSFIYHFNRWLGGLVLGLALWGAFSFYDLGGTFGRGIIGYPGSAFWGVLRVAGLVAVGIALIAPGHSWRAVRSFIGWVADWVRSRFERRKEAVPPAGLPPEGAEGLAEPASPPKKRAARDKEAALAEGGSPKKELKQVAQEVWRKYGQTAGQATADGWRLPPIDILDKTVEVEFSEADNLRRARLIEESLASYGVETKVVQINVGPTVTQFGVEPGWDRKFKEIREKDRDGNVKVHVDEVAKIRVKVDRITSLANDLALALAAPSLRIEAPVPGKSVVGIEVPNTVSSMVSLRGVVETSVFQKLTPKTKLAIALGKGAGGEAVAGDLTKMPHLLIAGATGSGKTVCLQTIICCLLLYCTPNDVRFVMIDPKRVELTSYNSIPHLATPVIVDTNKALNAMRWLNVEMDQRYQRLAAAGARNIEGFNKSRPAGERMPYLVLVIDELADLMMAGFDEVETILCRLAQLARAIGIHLVVATQRPSVDVITGLIKANFPTRISFAVVSQVDSRTILDMVGAEKLLGKGDMLYAPTEAAKPKRLQGCFVSDAEIERLVYFWSSQNRAPATGEVKIEPLVMPGSESASRQSHDPLMDTVRALAKEHSGRISTSFLQRRLHIGYPRAARLMEDYEAETGQPSEAGPEGAASERDKPEA